jgi:hypothetical protein
MLSAISDPTLAALYQLWLYGHQGQDTTKNRLLLFARLVLRAYVENLSRRTD